MTSQRFSMHARRARRLVLAALGAAVLVVSQVAVGMPSGLGVAARAAGPSGQPNRFAVGAATRSVNHLPTPPAVSGPRPGYSPPSAPPVPMRPGLVELDPMAGAQFGGSDGVLELTVPGGAVTAADVSAAGGRLSLLVRQVLPAAGTSAGGWGKYSFGTWLVQVVDGSGRPARQGLRQELRVSLHEGRRAGALD